MWVHTCVCACIYTHPTVVISMAQCLSYLLVRYEGQMHRPQRRYPALLQPLDRQDVLGADALYGVGWGWVVWGGVRMYVCDGGFAALRGGVSS